MTLTGNILRAWELGNHNEFPVIANGRIWQGAAVGDNGSGFARSLVAGDPFRGFALEEADNSTGVAGAIFVKVLRFGKVKLILPGLVLADVGRDVYAINDNTFTLTRGTNTWIGSVYRFTASGVGVVEFRDNSGTEPELIDNTGGTASDTLAAIVGIDVAAATGTAVLTVAEARNLVASLARKNNHFLRKQGN